jgi:two-component system, chemotaxis family, chemotaxis protein CheY
MRALVVDDSRVMRLIIGKIVKENGFEVIEAGNGEEAMTRLHASEEEINLALVDWNMPVMDGITFVQAARASGKYPALRMIMITTENGIEQVTRAIEAGADEYLMKPFTKESLRDKLALLGFETVAP